MRYILRLDNNFHKEKIILQMFQTYYSSNVENVYIHLINNTGDGIHPSAYVAVHIYIHPVRCNYSYIPTPARQKFESMNEWYIISLLECLPIRFSVINCLGAFLHMFDTRVLKFSWKYILKPNNVISGSRNKNPSFIINFIQIPMVRHSKSHWLANWYLLYVFVTANDVIITK